MALKLSSRQQAQIGFLQTVPPKLARIHAVIEQNVRLISPRATRIALDVITASA